MQDSEIKLLASSSLFGPILSSNVEYVIGRLLLYSVSAVHRGHQAPFVHC